MGKPPEEYDVGGLGLTEDFEFDSPGDVSAAMLTIIMEQTRTPLVSMIAVEMLKLSLDRIYSGMAHDQGIAPEQYEKEKLVGWKEAQRIAAEIVARHVRE